MRRVTPTGAGHNGTETTNRAPTPPPPTIQCRRCCGDGRQLTDTYIGTRDGRPVYRLRPQDCAGCNGLGHLTYQPTAGPPSPRPFA